MLAQSSIEFEICIRLDSLEITGRYVAIPSTVPACNFVPARASFRTPLDDDVFRQGAVRDSSDWRPGQSRCHDPTLPDVGDGADGIANRASPPPPVFWSCAAE